jgi:hypothetical protein
MKKLILIFLCLNIYTLGHAQFKKANLEVDYEAQASNDKANYTYKNLRLYPIRANDNFRKEMGDIGKYTPLREALSSKKVLITETGDSNPQPRQNNISNTNNRNLENTPQQRVNVRQRPQRNDEPQQQRVINEELGGSGTVNTLFIENISKDTIFIMAGEIVQGGKQDRVIAQDVLLPPASGKINLSVFCVEQGRWTYGDKTDKSFNQYYGLPNMQLRNTVEKANSQSKVWQEVARTNEKNKVNPSTGAYTAQLNSDDYKKQFADYQGFFTEKFKNDKNIIGVIVVTGERVVGCDMFASADLFQTQFNSLLSSYINEAITDGSEVKIKPQMVEGYVNELLDENRQKDFIEKRGKMFQTDKKKLRISTY